VRKSNRVLHTEQLSKKSVKWGSPKNNRGKIIEFAPQVEKMALDFRPRWLSTWGMGEI